MLFQTICIEVLINSKEAYIGRVHTKNTHFFGTLETYVPKPKRNFEVMRCNFADKLSPNFVNLAL